MQLLDSCFWTAPGCQLDWIEEGIREGHSREGKGEGYDGKGLVTDSRGPARRPAREGRRGKRFGEREAIMKGVRQGKAPVDAMKG